MVRLLGKREEKRNNIEDKREVFFSIATTSGITKSINQDNIYVMRTPVGAEDLNDYNLYGKQKLPALFAVCDGMGGEAFGEKASAEAVNKLANIEVNKLASMNKEEIETELIQTIQTINDDIFNKYASVGRVMGCTMTVLYMDKRNIFVINVGDSPGIRYDSEGYAFVTFPDNHANKLYMMGEISEQERWTHRSKSQLTQCIGMDPDEVVLSPHVYYEKYPEEGVTFVLCSDGLTDGLSFEDIRSEIDGKWKRKVAKKLVDRAVTAGSRDNITALVVRI